MGKAASTGKIAQVKTDLEFNVWSPLAIIKPTLNRLIPTYLEYCLKSYPGQIQIDLLCTSNTQKNISMEDIPRIILPEPSYNDQTAIVDKRVFRSIRIILQFVIAATSAVHFMFPLGQIYIGAVKFVVPYELITLCKSRDWKYNNTH